MRAALAWVERQAAAIIVAVPVAAPEMAAAFEADGIRVLTLIRPDGFGSVGAWYGEFDEVTSDDVRSLLVGAT